METLKETTDLQVYPDLTLEAPKYGVFVPQPDMTPQEAAYISIMLSGGAVLALNGFTPDFVAFIERHDLVRHFSK